MERTLRHQFLLAMPGLAAGYFGGSIIYVCEHDEDGTFGLMVNRAVEGVVLGELFDQLDVAGTSHRDAMVLEGGPVQTDRGFVLHSDEVMVEGSMRVGGGIALSASREMLVAIAGGNGPARFVVCVGYSGWGPGQLEQELGQNAWLTCDGDAEVLFDAPLEERVDRAAASLGIDFRLISGDAGHA